MYSIIQTIEHLNCLITSQYHSMFSKIESMKLFHILVYLLQVSLLCSIITLQVSFLCYATHFVGSAKASISVHNSMKCINHEREALLTLKKSFEHDDHGLLSSWGNKRDCCEWQGIHCSNRTGHVIALNLHGFRLRGKIDPSLFELKHLISLDLSYNDIYFVIPKSIDSLTKLEHLNLSWCSIIGEIPHQLGNLSRLVSLDLSGAFLSFVNVTSLQWLSRLTMLTDIRFNGIDLGIVDNNYVHILNNLPHLSTIYLNWCNLSRFHYRSLSYINSSITLHYIDLSNNYIKDTSIFQWFFNLTRIGNRIEYIDLSSNSLSGFIPSGLGMMRSLSYLSLEENGLVGSIPSELGNMHSLLYLSLERNGLVGTIPSELGSLNSLSHLSLSHNGLEGLIPDSFSKLKFLQFLDLKSNNLQGSIEKPLSNKCNLEHLKLSSNNFVDDLSKVMQTLSIGCTKKRLLKYLNLEKNQLWGSVPDIITTFTSLKKLYLGSNRLNGTISPGIGQLTMLNTLMIRNNTLEVTLNHTHFLNLLRLESLGLSENRALVLDIDAGWKPPFQLYNIDLRSCKLGPSFPKWLLTQTNVFHLDISSSGISDSLPTTFWTKLLSPNLTYLNVSHNEMKGLIPNLSTTFSLMDMIDLSSNRFQGSIPAFRGPISILYLNNNYFTDSHGLLCRNNHSNLLYLDLSNNSFSGELPDCWMNFSQLLTLNLENNRFSGKIPTSNGSLKQLSLFYLANNSFFGELPVSLKNCSHLELLDVGHNSLTGYIPSWIGYAFPSLGLLNLRGNHFRGSLPSSLCQLFNLQILDLGINYLTGTIPRCFDNLSSMINTSYHYKSYGGYMIYSSDYEAGEYDYTGSAVIEWKREEQRLGATLVYFVLIDLSNNMLQGNIPNGIYHLKGLVSLDLSSNNLSGIIASNIGELTSLQMLDLSNNHLSGEIPKGLAKLNFLEILDLSNNNLLGKIPTGPQLQLFNASSYLGNPHLCGAPLPYCPGDEPHTQTFSGENQQDDEGSNDMYRGLYISVALGFMIGFWGVCGTLVVKGSWRRVFFQFFEDVKEKLYVIWVFNVARAWRNP